MGTDNESMTLDELSSIYRMESKSTGLSDVRKDLYASIAKLSEATYKEYESHLSIDPGSVASEGTNERRKRIETLSQKIVEMRMEKVNKLALRVAMGDGIDQEFFTHEEKEYYNVILESSRKHTSLISKSRSRTKETVLKLESVPPVTEKEIPAVIEPKPEEIQEVHDIETEAVDENETITIRILEDLQEFSGRDMDYLLKKEDVVKMPAIMANALISRELAVRFDVTL